MLNTIKDYKKLTTAPWGRMFYDMIYQQLNLPKDQELNILDFGAGFCIIASHYANQHKVTAIEPNKTMIALSEKNKRYKLICGSIEALKALENETYDIVICHNVLEYCENKEEIICGLAKVLKPGGILSIIKHNKNGKIISEAVFNQNPENALKLMQDKDNASANMFGKKQYYNNEFLMDITQKNNLVCKNIFGIRAFFALSADNTIKYTDKWYQNMLKLEMEVCDIPDFRNIAFYHHLLFLKKR